MLALYMDVLPFITITEAIRHTTGLTKTHKQIKDKLHNFSYEQRNLVSVSFVFPFYFVYLQATDVY